MSNLLQCKLNNHVVIFDGAMGTSLYNRNFFINSCYEYLNITSPDTVRSIHLDYVAAGAEILTANTYGANRLKLARHGLAERVAEINQAGVSLARMAGNENTLIAGSVGPIGRQCGGGVITIDEQIDVYVEQIEALQSAGCDFIIAETIPSTADGRAFLGAIKKCCKIPYMMSFAVDRDLELALGENLELFIAEIESFELAPTALGLNCGMGPEAMLAAVEKLVKVCHFPIVAQPNAGTPKSVDNRTIYMCSPEYLTTYAIRYVSLGVRGVGGCCGTTAEHIFDLARSVSPLKHTPQLSRPIIRTAEPVELLPEIALSERSSLAEKIVEHKFVRMVEITPPKGFDLSGTIEKSIICKKAGIDAINLPDGPRASSRISSLVTASEIQQKAGIEAILHLCCRDKNLIGMQSDLLGCAYLGINNILFITGDPPKLGDYPFASGVFDVDSVGILAVATGLNRGIDIGGKSIGKVPTQFFPGAGVDPNALDISREFKRMREKAEAGAKYFITQPIFEVKSLLTVLEEAERLGVPVIAGVWPLASYRNAEFMNNEVPGVVIPEEIMRKMAAAVSRDEQYAAGIEIARATISEIRNLVAGVQVSAPFGRVESALAVLEGF